LLSIIGKEEKGGDQDMMCLLQLTVTARDSIYCPVEGGGEEERRKQALLLKLLRQDDQEGHQEQEEREGGEKGEGEGER
jgi:hypothetical protein